MPRIITSIHMEYFLIKGNRPLQNQLLQGLYLIIFTLKKELNEKFNTDKISFSSSHLSPVGKIFIPIH